MHQVVFTLGAATGYPRRVCATGYGGYPTPPSARPNARMTDVDPQRFYEILPLAYPQTTLIRSPHDPRIDSLHRHAPALLRHSETQ